MMRSSLVGVENIVGQCAKYFTVYFIVLNNLLNLKTTNQLSILGGSGLVYQGLPWSGCCCIVSPAAVESTQPRWSLYCVLVYCREGTTTTTDLSYSVFLVRKRSWCVGLNDLSGWTLMNSYLAQARVYAFCISRIRLYLIWYIIRRFHSSGLERIEYISECVSDVCMCVCVWARVCCMESATHTHTHSSLGQSIGRFHVRSPIELLYYTYTYLYNCLVVLAHVCVHHTLPM